MKYLIIISSLVCCVFWSSNPLQAQSQACGDPAPDWPNILTAAQVNQYAASNFQAPSFNIRIKFHILRQTNGTTGPSVADINTQLGYLNANFASHNISFTLDPTNFINNSNYVTGSYVGTYSDGSSRYVPFTRDTLYPQYGATNRLDIFVWPSEFGFLAGNAINIPNDYMAISEVKFSALWSAHISHEAGHCLNLLHTHQSANLTCPNAAKEEVDGGNCATAGDLCCDTPADPKLNNGGSVYNTSTCTYSDTVPRDCENAIYTPDGANIMSYGNQCRSIFSVEQRNRMHAELSFGAKGPNMLVCNTTLAVTGTITDGLYSANTTVNCNGDVNSGANVQFSAGTTINFTTGTKLSSGSSVKASLGGCNPN